MKLEENGRTNVELVWTKRALIVETGEVSWVPIR